MSGYLDLHCHWLPGVDDGAPSLGVARAMLLSLAELGFEQVIATPHLRPGLFDNTEAGLRAAFDAAERELRSDPRLPHLELSAEHYFDEPVLARLMMGQGLPYPGGRAVLLEFYQLELHPAVALRVAELRQGGLLPVVAHPERYPAIAHRPELLDQLEDAGAVSLLDLGSLAGRYGRRTRELARLLLEHGRYHAACSDAHRLEDMAAVRAGLQRVRRDWGEAEVRYLLDEGPRALLCGRVPR